MFGAVRNRKPEGNNKNAPAVGGRRRGITGKPTPRKGVERRGGMHEVLGFRSVR